MIKYRFNGFVEYVPKNDREWHVERKNFTKEIRGMDKSRAEVKLQVLATSLIPVPASRIVLEYDSEVIDEMG